MVLFELISVIFIKEDKENRNEIIVSSSDDEILISDTVWLYYIVYHHISPWPQCQKSRLEGADGCFSAAIEVDNLPLVIVKPFMLSVIYVKKRIWIIRDIPDTLIYRILDIPGYQIPPDSE